MLSVLLIDEDDAVTHALARVLEQHGAQCYSCNSVTKGLSLLERTPEIKVVVAEPKQVPSSVQAPFHRIKQLHPEVAVIVLTGYSEISAIQRLVNDGKIDHLLFKPWHDDELVTVVNQYRENLTDTSSAYLTVNSNEERIDQLKAELIDRERMMSICLSTQHRYEQVIECIPLGCMVFSNELLMVLINAQARQITHLDESCIGRKASDVFTNEFTQALLDNRFIFTMKHQGQTITVKQILLSDELGEFGRLLVLGD